MNFIPLYYSDKIRINLLTFINFLNPKIKMRLLVLFGIFSILNLGHGNLKFHHGSNFIAQLVLILKFIFARKLIAKKVQLTRMKLIIL